jgi:3D (Asp-Asp-Asp) domain-containing protein
MSKPLRFALVLLFAGWFAGCETQSTGPHLAPIAQNGARRMTNVRTTAYTHSEGSARNAIGLRLSGGAVGSAAADWSRFPLGTKFRLVDTHEVFQIDDYGWALVGTNTIDLYKPSRLAMRRWGVRRVDIDVIEWGSREKSLKVLAPRGRNRQIRRMMVALRDKSQWP